VCAAALLVAIAYTDFFRDASGLTNLVRNLGSMVAHGASTADAVSLHRHPASFYASILLRHEWLTLALALAGILCAVRTRRPLTLILAFDALLTATIHFMLPYKTPWLLLTPLLPLALLAGLGGEWVLSRLHAGFPKRWALVAACLLPMGMLPQAIDASFLRPAEPSLGLAYHHASAEQIELAGRIRRIIEKLPEGTYPKAVIALPYYWPLAWYLRDKMAVIFEASAIPVEPMEALETVPVVLTLESADPRFLDAFLRSESVPPFDLPGHTGRSVLLVAPHYMVGRLWIRNDLISQATPP
jgi:predicted membrane-bound mannosyltransferase